MKTISIFTAFWVLVSSTFAADRICIVKDDCVVLVTLNDDGTTETETILENRIVRLSGSVNPPPDPPKPDSIARVVQEGVDLVTDEDKEVNAKKLAAIYALVASEARKGTFENSSEIPNATTRLIDMGLGSAAEAWKPFRSHLGRYLTEIGKKGEMSTPEKVATVFDNIAESLELLFPSAMSEEVQGSFDAWLELLMKLLPIILEAIRK